MSCSAVKQLQTRTRIVADGRKPTLLQTAASGSKDPKAHDAAPNTNVRYRGPVLIT